MRRKAPKKMSTGSILGAVINKSLKKNKVTGKAKAGEAGNLFESVILSLERCFGFEICKSCKGHVVRQSLFDDKDSSSLVNRIECNVSYNSVLRQTAERYGIKTRNGTPHTEFVLSAYNIKPTSEFPDIRQGKENRIRVECKYQNTAGTTEHKLLHSYLDLRYGAPEKDVILLVDGDGFTEKMIAFIKEVCDEETVIWTKGIKKKKNVRFMNVDQFVDWANRAFGSV